MSSLRCVRQLEGKTMTAYLTSTYEEVQKLRFHPLKSKTPVDGRVCRVDRTIVVVTDKGWIYSSQVNDRMYYSAISNVDDTLEALFKLGRISKEAFEGHVTARRALHAKRNLKWQAESVKDYVEALGIKLTKPQLVKLNKAMEVEG
jgi:hypothetical protein